MRKFILISAMVLASATAQAGQSRNLSPVAANDEQPVVTTTTVQPPRAAEADTSRIPVEPVSTVPAPPAPPVVTSPSYEERPPAVTPAATTTTTAPPLANPPTTTTTTVTPPAKADAPRRTAKAGRRGRGGYWTEARIIGELHRYGIYW